MILGLFTDLEPIGGVQRAGRHIAAVMTEFASGSNKDCQLLSLNDSCELHHMSVAGREFVFSGCAKSKFRFVAPAMSRVWGGIELILAAYPSLGPVAPVLKGLGTKTKSVVIAHGVEVWTPLPSVRRMALRMADLVLTPTRDTAKQVAANQGVAEERIRVLPWAIDPDFLARVSQTKKRTLPAGFPEGRVILTVGRWSGTERYKGVDTLIKVLPRLVGEFPDVQLVVAGGGGDENWLQRMAEDQHVSQHVHFFRDLSYEDLAACYAACEIFAMPSRGEGFGLVYLEAMACAKPVIGGNHGGAPEVIEDGRTGFLVKYGDTDELTSSLGTLLADPGLARRMGSQGRDRVFRDFHFDTFAKSFKHILTELCDS
jgi:phosphatidyl-myo-inositol dimannoside synthase